jgi:hypothetical protein
VRACYEDRPDYFDGIAYIFSADDPYVGGDFDHCLDESGQMGDFAAAHLPATYAEKSASGVGVKFIALAANLPSGRKTARAELYSRARMFCLTGQVLDQAHSAITHQQAAIDALLAALGSTKRSGGDANGDRRSYGFKRRARPFRHIGGDEEGMAGDGWGCTSMNRWPVLRIGGHSDNSPPVSDQPDQSQCCTCVAIDPEPFGSQADGAGRSTTRSDGLYECETARRQSGSRRGAFTLLW